MAGRIRRLRTGLLQNIIYRREDRIEALKQRKNAINMGLTLRTHFPTGPGMTQELILLENNLEHEKKKLGKEEAKLRKLKNTK
jgi:hypothetical protein